MADLWDHNKPLSAQVQDDEDIPDNWDDEPQEKPKKTEDEKPETLTKAPPTAKNKLNKKKYTVDDNEAFLESLKEPNREYTAEELDELKKRAELQQEETKLNMATDFIGTSGEKNSLDNINLITKEEFLDYSFRLYNRLELLSKSEFYPEFLDHLLTGLTKFMTVDNVKRLQSTLHAILLRKQNEEREKKSNKTKKSVKPQLKADRKTEYDSFVGEGIEGVDDYAEYDQDNDFM